MVMWSKDSSVTLLQQRRTKKQGRVCLFVSWSGVSMATYFSWGIHFLGNVATRRLKPLNTDLTHFIHLLSSYKNFPGRFFFFSFAIHKEMRRA